MVATRAQTRTGQQGASEHPVAAAAPSRAPAVSAGTEGWFSKQKPPQKEISTAVSFRDEVLSRLQTPHVSHLFEQERPNDTDELNISDWDDKSYRIRAGNLVTGTPIVGGTVGQVLNWDFRALVTEVNAVTGRITLCNGVELYDDSNEPEFSLEGLGCNWKVKVYSLDDEGKLQHASDNEFVPWHRLRLETSKLMEGSYKSITEIIYSIHAKLRLDANLFASKGQMESAKKNVLTDPLFQKFCELIDRMMHQGEKSKPLVLKKGEPFEPFLFVVSFHCLSSDTTTNSAKQVVDETENAKEFSAAPGDGSSAPPKTPTKTDLETSSDDESPMVTRKRKAHSVSDKAEEDDWQFADLHGGVVEQNALLFLTHQMMAKDIDGGCSFCQSNAPGELDLIGIRDLVLEGFYNADESIFYAAMSAVFSGSRNDTGVEERSKQMSKFFNALFDDYKRNKVSTTV